MFEHVFLCANIVYYDWIFYDEFSGWLVGKLTCEHVIELKYCCVSQMEVAMNYRQMCVHAIEAVDKFKNMFSKQVCVYKDIFQWGYHRICVSRGEVAQCGANMFDCSAYREVGKREV